MSTFQFHVFPSIVCAVGLELDDRSFWELVVDELREVDVRVPQRYAPSNRFRHGLRDAMRAAAGLPPWRDEHFRRTYTRTYDLLVQFYTTSCDTTRHCSSPKEYQHPSDQPQNGVCGRSENEWNRVAQLGCISHQPHRILARSSILGSGLDSRRSCGHALQIIMALLRTC